MSTLQTKLAAGQFTLTVELDPPKSADAAKTIAEAQELKNRIDAVNIADCPMANLRMSPIALSHVIQADVGLETIFHLTCRDRNIIGLQAELLGAAALGVHNILALTGDHPQQGDHPHAKAVFETDSTGLIELSAQLNSGKDTMGNALGKGTSFFIGTAVNPGADDLDKELAKLAAKIDAGARFVQTQPVYDLEIAKRFMEKVRHLPIYVLMGVLPLKSHKMALYLHEKVPGITIPTAIMDRMAAGGKTAGLEIAAELVRGTKNIAHGVHIMPLNDIQTVVALTDQL
jgi:5,10-methylenetetrahydrofolate reductase